MQNIMVETVEILENLDHAHSSDAVWQILNRFIPQLSISALVYRNSSLMEFGQGQNENMVTESFSSDGEHQIEVMNFAYEKEYTQPGLELRKRTFWKSNIVLPRIYENNKKESEQLSHDKTMTGILFPVIAEANRKAVFILAFADANRRYLKEEIYAITSVCQKAHQILTAHSLEKVRTKIRLSTRQKEILAGISQGKSNIDIAKQTGLSRHTVDAYLRRIFLKIGVTDRTSAALVAIRNDLISKPHYCKTARHPSNMARAS